MSDDVHRLPIRHPDDIAKLRKAISWLQKQLGQGEKWTVVITRKRSDEQNARMWAILQKISDQLMWNGHHHSKEEWKDFLMHMYRSKSTWMMDENNQPVPVGMSTRKLSVGQFNDFFEVIEGFAQRHDVDIEIGG